MGNIGNANNIELTEQQKTGIDNRIAELKQLLESQRYAPGFDESNPNHRLFFQAFDGTGNDRDNVPDGDRHTNPDVLEDLIPDSQAVVSRYRSGVGTDGDLDKLNYPGGDGSIERAEEAYKNLVTQTKQWYWDDPDVEVYISTMGFSRGTGSARHFANLVYERGVPAEDAQADRVLVGYEDQGRDTVPVYEITYDKYIISPGEAKLDTMLLYDSVATGQTQSMKLDIPPVEGLKVLHLTANDEQRDQFDLQSVIDPGNDFDHRLYEFGLPGAHGDLGGGYADNWLSARYLELGHTFLKQNGVPLRDIPDEYQVSPDAVGVIHDPDKLYYTTFGDRQISYSDNKVVTDTVVVSNQWLQQNLLARLEYIDSSYTSAEYALEWARTHPEDPEAVKVLAREAEIERDLERLSDMKAQIFHSPDLSLETMAEYNRQFAGRQSEADRRMHEREYDADISTVSVFTEDGSLNPEFITAFDTPETATEFLRANANLQLADAGSDVLQREYATYVYNKALTEAAASTGRDVAEILNLNVPGNPNAEGYHYQPDAEPAAGISIEDLAGFLKVSETEVATLAENGELAARVAQRQAELQQSQGIQTASRGLGELVAGVDDGDVLDMAIGVGRLALGTDRILDNLGGESGFLEADTAAGMQAGLAAAGFVDDVLAGDELGAIVSGVHLVDDLGTVAKIDALDGLTDLSGVGVGLGVLSLAGAIDSGDAASIAGAGFQAADLVSDGALSAALPGEAVPYGSYIMAGVQLLDGNVEQAGLSAMSGYLIATGNPGAVAAGVALSLFGGSLLGSETPKAWADFKINDDGSVGIDVNYNRTGDGLEAPVTDLAEGLTPVFDQVRSAGIEIQPDSLPRIGIRGDEYYLEHAGATRLITDPAAELPELTQMSLIGDWMLANGIDRFSLSGRDRYLGATDWSHTVRGTGVFAGGGQVRHAPVTIDAKNIVSLNDPTLWTVSQQLAKATRTWRVDKSLFAGEGGALLAAGLGAGLVQYAEIAEAIADLPDPVSLVEHADTADFVAAAGSDNLIAAGTGRVDVGDPAGPVSSTSVTDEIDVDLAPFYTGQRMSIYDKVSQRLDYETANRVGSAVSDVPINNTGSSPVFAPGDEISGLDAESARLRALANGGHINNDNDVEPGSAGGDGGGSNDGESPSDPSSSGDKAGSKAPFPGTDFLSMVEDRFLVTTADRLTDNDGDGTRFFALGSAQHGSVTMDANGNIRFTPPPDYFGDTGFSYQVQTASGSIQTRQVRVTVEGRNDRPEAVDDNLASPEDQAFPLSRLLANDTDIDGDPVEIVAVSQVSQGRVEADAAGVFRYVSPADYSGEVQLVYVIEDAAGVRSAARATLAIHENGNDAPVVRSVVLEDGIEEQVFTFHASELLDQADDPEGGALALEAMTAVQGGTVTWDRDTGEVVFTPAPDFHGLARVEFVVSDPQGLTTTGSAGIVFENIPDPFTAGDTRVTVNEDDVVVFKPGFLLPRLHVDNPDGGEVAIVGARMAPGMPGRVNHLPDGSVQWIPPREYSGPSAFELRLFNGAERTVSRVDIDVAAVNDVPVIRPDTFSTGVEDQAFSFDAADLLANDQDAEGDAFTVTDVQLRTTEAGVLSFDAATGDVRIDPASDFFGNAQLEYTVTETASGRLTTGSATVVFAGRDDTAVITDKTFALNEDETRVFPRDILLDVLEDADGESIAITDVRLGDPGTGTLDLLNDGNVRFVPAPEFSGDTSFEIDTTDGVTAQTARIELTVKAVNDAPVGLTHQFSGAQEDRIYQFDESDLLNGATDAENDTISVASVQLKTGQGGVLEHDPADGRLVYTPKADFFGEVELEYRLRDARGAESTQDAGIVFEPIEDDFAVTNRQFTLNEDQVRIFTRDVLLDTSTDPDGQVLKIDTVRIGDLLSGAVDLLPGGDIRFTPASEFSGQTKFEYDVTDGTHTHTAVATLTVLEENDAPITGSDRFTNAVEDEAFSFTVDDLIANDFDPEGDAFVFSGIQAVDPQTGSLSWEESSGELIFTPAADFFGEAWFTYTLEELDTGQIGQGSAAIVFQGVDDTPVVSDKDMKDVAFNLDEDEARTFEARTLLGDVVDVDGERLRITGARMLDSAQGQVSLTSDGSVRFEPAADYVGEAPFHIDVSDGHSTVTATITPRLWPQNDAPRPQDDVASMNEDSALIVSATDLLANDSDPDDARADLRIVGPWATSTGIARYDASTGELHYTPAQDEFGAAWVDYIVEDDDGAFSVARLDVTVINIDDPVIAVDDVVWVDEDADRVFDPATFLANDINVDQEQLDIVAIDHSEFTRGNITLTADGRIDYRAEADFSGAQSFTYIVQDESGNLSTAAVKLIVEEINDAPRVTRTGEQVLEDHNIVFNVDNLLGNATDVEDDWMQVVGARSDHGTVDFDVLSGEVAFAPDANLNTDLNGGPLVFEYLVQDEKGGETWAAVDIDVIPVNDPPRAGSDTLFVWESGPGGYTNPVATSSLLANDTEVDGEPIRIDRVSSGVNGVVTLNAIGDQVRYRADAGFTGQDSFTYRVTDDVINADGSVSADTGEVAINVLDNRAPVAHDFATLVPEDTILNFDIDDFMTHVDDQDLGILELPEDHRIVEVSGAANGQAILNGDGTVSFIPNANYNSVQHGGMATFNYVVEDIVGHRSEAGVSITYASVNDDPTAVNDGINQTVYEEQAAFIDIDDLLANDFDVDDNPGESSVRFDGLVGGSPHGSVSVQGDQIRYIGDTNFFGNDSFQYRVVDGQGGADTATVQLKVTNVNDRPVVEFDSAQADDSGPNTIGGLLNNDFDVDGDTLRIVNPSQGSVVNGGTAIRLNAENRGHDYHTSITYGVTDGQETVQSRLDLQIMHVNRPPSSLTRIQTDADSVFVAGNDPDTPDPIEKFAGGTISFSGYTWKAEVGTAAGIGAGQNGLFIDLTNQFGHPVSWSNDYEEYISGTGTFSYTIEVLDGDNVVHFNGSISTPVSLRNTNYFGGGKPVVIDFNRDGFNLLGAEESAAKFDWNDDGVDDSTGWIAGEGDAILAFDHDGDRLIDQRSEIAFVDYLEDAQTDLEGLRAFDTNNNGLFDARDEKWSQFGLWIDDGDAASKENEFVAMDQSNIQSLALHSDERAFDMNGNTVYGLAEVTFLDGSTGELGDVAFKTFPAAAGQTAANDSEAEAAAAAENDGADLRIVEAENEDPGDRAGDGRDNHEGESSISDDSGTGETDPHFGSSALGKEPGDINTSSDSNSVSSEDVSTAPVPVTDTDGATPKLNAEVEDDLELPTDEELDQMAQSDNAQAAATAPEEPVSPVDVETVLNDGGGGMQEENVQEEIDMAA